MRCLSRWLVRESSGDGSWKDTACPRTHRRWHGLLFEISEGGSNGVSWKGGGGPGVRSTIGPTHLNQYGEDPRMGQDHGKAREASLLPLFRCPLKNYLAMLQRVMPLGEKYFARPLGSEGILSLSLHHSAREGRPQGH